MESKDPIEAEFTGEESDNFVRFAEELLTSGLQPHVRVEGREPITSNPVSFEGVVIGTKFDRYIRYLEVRAHG